MGSGATPVTTSGEISSRAAVGTACAADPHRGEGADDDVASPPGEHPAATSSTDDPMHAISRHRLTIFVPFTGTDRELAHHLPTDAHLHHDAAEVGHARPTRDRPASRTQPVRRGPESEHLRRLNGRRSPSSLVYALGRCTLGHPAPGSMTSAGSDEAIPMRMETLRFVAVLTLVTVCSEPTVPA